MIRVAQEEWFFEGCGVCDRVVIGGVECGIDRLDEKSEEEAGVVNAMELCLVVDREV
jgi:hypothetical protein